MTATEAKNFDFRTRLLPVLVEARGFPEIDLDFHAWPELVAIKYFRSCFLQFKKKTVTKLIIGTYQNNACLMFELEPSKDARVNMHEWLMCVQSDTRRSI